MCWDFAEFGACTKPWRPYQGLRDASIHLRDDINLHEDVVQAAFHGGADGVRIGKEFLVDRVIRLKVSQTREVCCDFDNVLEARAGSLEDKSDIP